MMSDLYHGVLPQIASIAGFVGNTQDIVSTETKQKFVQAIYDFKDGVSHAKENAAALPGGELAIENQDDVIQLLQTLKSNKKYTLHIFAEAIAKRPSQGSEMTDMDSTASTPVGV